MKEKLKSIADGIQTRILGVEKEVAEMKKNLWEASDGDVEAMSNVMLSYRHLEDARMRMGKCIQALDGGMSIYDKEEVAE